MIHHGPVAEVGRIVRVVGVLIRVLDPDDIDNVVNSITILMIFPLFVQGAGVQSLHTLQSGLVKCCGTTESCGGIFSKHHFCSLNKELHN